MVLRRGGVGSPRKLEPMRWGLVPSWATDPKIGNHLALARIETAATSRAFRDAMRHRRCLIAVDGFYEWKRAGKKSAQPFFISRVDGRPFALGGIWERWVSKDGEVIESCAILTRPADPSLDAVHDRMPLVVEPLDWPAWLEPATPGPPDLATLLSRHSPEIVARAVSTHVNDTRHDDPSCVEPQTREQLSLALPERHSR
jgi:putative SOS response-associated peptidase YedK